MSTRSLTTVGRVASQSAVRGAVPTSVARTYKEPFADSSCRTTQETSLDHFLQHTHTHLSASACRRVESSTMSLPPTYVEGFHNKDDVLRMPYRPLGKTGLQVSVLSLGASSLGSVFRDTDEQECIEVVKEAVRVGINYIDVAPFYGQTKAETVLGKALKDIPRQAYYVATKVSLTAIPRAMYGRGLEPRIGSGMAPALGYLCVLEISYSPAVFHDIAASNTSRWDVKSACIKAVQHYKVSETCQIAVNMVLAESVYAQGNWAIIGQEC